MSPLAGKLRLFSAVFSFLLFSSCIIAPAEKSLNPRLLFTVGSEFLENIESVALKGSIDFEDKGGNQAGTFQLVINRGDSLAFIIEGPFKIDVFRLIIADGAAYVMDKESDNWVVVSKNEKILIPDYGVDSIIPDAIGYCLFPQFYMRTELRLDAEKMLISSDEYDFHIAPSRNQTSFTLSGGELNLSAFYGRRKNLNGGYYPSLVEISSPQKDWRITIEIERIKLNPKISSKIWERN